MADAETINGATFEAWKECAAQRKATACVICGGKTRKGTPCHNKSDRGKRRCQFHGGKSTGARTPEGIERIREAQRQRWTRAWHKTVATLIGNQAPDPAVTHELSKAAPHART